jgi:hypothetical protein
MWRRKTGLLTLVDASNSRARRDSRQRPMHIETAIDEG